MFLGSKTIILQDKLDAGDVIVLDGATGTEIARMGGMMNDAAWCAVANKTHPDIVRGVHEEYIRAGADVVIANTFATCRHVLAKAGLADETVAINKRAVELARQARDNVAASRPVAVAGSMSNMAAWIDGTVSPDPAFFPTLEQEAANQREMADALAEAGADFLILEMMSKLDRATLCMEAAVATGLPVWVGISCSQLPDGTMIGWDMTVEEKGRLAPDHKGSQALPLEELIDTLKAIGGDVFGIMHSSIEATTPGLEVLFDRWDGPVMAYPETIHHNAQTVPVKDFAGACRGWVDSGVQIIGGCCGTTIEHIRAMVDELPAEVGPRKAA
ncbi:MAG: homocysteine S-methyltransferase family protein [Alphaproteobacteria bacterium]|nr:homocysteine S-methyltransferase family protein [Rhodospirillaceae bacterium]MBT7648216.1 homocysteine S-methyltransferase family protein [Rhodospirillaceae bacterium]MDG2481924.1 homocysteine S-methyltransferase family protein [Alphaproteobacteria bacterium]